MNVIKNDFPKSKLIVVFPVVLFFIFSVWWAFLKTLHLDSTNTINLIWGSTYQILALYGGVAGLYIAQKWAGSKSLTGKIILAFSAGLLLQVFGQSYSSYHVFHYRVDSLPYPAVGDIGFFGSVIAYIYGVMLLARVSGVKQRITSVKSKILLFLIPLVFLVGSYGLFLRGYEFDWSKKITILLDFGYPLGQAFYVSIATLALIMSRNILGGVMKKPILFLLIALLFQYVSDSYFLILAHSGMWHAGGLDDYLYCISYFIMALAIISIGKAFETIKAS